MGKGGRIALAVAAVVVAVVLFLVLRPDSTDDEGARSAAATAAETQASETGSETTQATTEGEEATAEGEDGTTTQAPEVVRARIRVGANGPTRVQRIDARQGQRVVISVDSQFADEIHLHGYDLSTDVAPGERARIEFRADTPGRFTIELEERGQEIAQLRVTP